MELILDRMPQLSEEMTHRAEKRMEKAPDAFDQPGKKASDAAFTMMMVMMMGRMSVFFAAHGLILCFRYFFCGFSADLTVMPST